MATVSGFELDTEAVGAMAKALHATPAAPVTAGTTPAASYFSDLTAACAGFRSAWATGVDAMGQDVTRLAGSVQYAVIAYEAADQRASTSLGPK